MKITEEKLIELLELQDLEHIRRSYEERSEKRSKFTYCRESKIREIIFTEILANIYNENPEVYTSDDLLKIFITRPKYLDHYIDLVVKHSLVVCRKLGKRRKKIHKSLLIYIILKMIHWVAEGKRQLYYTKNWAKINRKSKYAFIDR
jgi:hypothetical protein